MTPMYATTISGVDENDRRFSHLDFLLRHLLTVVFVAFLIEGAGLPLPSRLLLLVAATLATDVQQRVWLVAASAAGSLLGDHVPYPAGSLTGPRILALYCRITLGSSDRVEKTAGYFRRFGALAVLLSRFSASVRLFASALYWLRPHRLLEIHHVRRGRHGRLHHGVGDGRGASRRAGCRAAGPSNTSTVTSSSFVHRSTLTLSPERRERKPSISHHRAAPLVGLQRRVMRHRLRDPALEGFSSSAAPQHCPEVPPTHSRA